MDLTKKIELYFGKSPVSGDTDEMQIALSNIENEFCAVYAKTDLPWHVHNVTNDIMLAKFGSHSKFAEENHDYIKPYQVDEQTGLASIGVIDANAQKFRGSGYRAGGTFFSLGIADVVLQEFQKLGYTVDKKYK